MGDPYLLRSEARIAFQLNLLYYLTKNQPGKPPGRSIPKRTCLLFNLDDQIRNQTLSFTFHYTSQPGGDEGTRTPGLRRAKAALSQTELHPHKAYGVVGLTGFEPVTPALSAQCSNQLSYRPG